MPKKNPISSPNDKGLDDRQEKFCHEYLKDFNATRAAKESGYSVKTANEQASRLLANVNIQGRIRELSEKALIETGDPIIRIINELQLIAFGDIKDLAEWDRWSVKWKESKDIGIKSRIIQEISETSNSTGGSRKIKMYDKLKAMEMLMKYYGVFKDEPPENQDHEQRVVIKMIPNGREKDRVIDAEFKDVQ